MVWSQIEATPPHLTYLILASFLISYCLFTWFIRNRLHLSEPPIALLVGIFAGPRILGWLTPNFCGVNGCPEGFKIPGETEVGGWGWGDNVVQEATRVIVGVQVFLIGVELPKYYVSKHWRSIAMLLGPVMTAGWLICALFVWWIFVTDVPTALITAACLTPTDPVLAASILSNSQFSTRLPKRIKDMLSAESGCNDGTSFPFLYVGLFVIREAGFGSAAKEWFLITILWQCTFGLLVGLCLGTIFNKLLRFSDERGFIDEPAFKVFYLLLALLSVGIGSTLGADDFLVAFGCGYGFARDGWFSEKTKDTKLPLIIDLLLNSAMFVYLGTIIPWFSFEAQEITPWVTPGRLVAFLILVLCFRRIPVVLCLYKWIPDIRTAGEALFCGHFGPMGLGGLFLAIEARAVLETGTSLPLTHPPRPSDPPTKKDVAIATVWPVVCFVVFGSTIVHGLSVLILSIIGHFSRSKSRRAGILAAETEALDGMYHDDPSEGSDSGAGDL